MNIQMTSAAQASAGRFPALAERTFTSVLAAHVARQPDKLAVRDPVRSLSYGALHDEALAVARGLARIFHATPLYDQIGADLGAAGARNA